MIASGRIALVTGANQGLGRALVEHLAARMDAAGPRRTHRPRPWSCRRRRVRRRRRRVARVEGRVLDVRDGAAIAALAAELGRGRHRLLERRRAHDPGRRPGRRGRRGGRDQQPRHDAHAARLRPEAAPRWAAARSSPARSARWTSSTSASPGASLLPPTSLDAVDTLVDDWRRAVHAGRAEQEGYGRLAEHPLEGRAGRCRAGRRARAPRPDLAANRLIAALCPGLIDTAASRPWFADMSRGADPGSGRAVAGRAGARRHLRPGVLRRARPVRPRAAVGIRPRRPLTRRAAAVR